MPRRKVYRKKVYRRPKVAAKTVARIAKRVYMRNTETKSREYSFDNVGAVPAGNFNSISYGTGAVAAGLVSGISPGTDDNQRIGRKVFIRGVRIYFVVNGADADKYNKVRFMLVSPRHGGDYADFSSIVANFVSGVLSNAASSSTQYANPIDTRTYHVLMDRTISITPTETSAGVFTATPKILRKFIKINKSSYWTEGNNTTAQREWYLIAISDSALPGHPGVIAGNVKLYFKDG